MTLQPGPVDGDAARYAGHLNEHWTIGPKIHGGVMLALCAKAARCAGGDGLEPMVVSANYLRAPDPGAVELQTEGRKRGRQVSLVDVERVQDGRVAVRAAVTLGGPEQDAAALLDASPVVAAMSPEPPADIAAIGPGHPLAGVNHLVAGCDIRIDLSELTPGTAAPRTRIWVRPRDEAPDELFALLCGDISAPMPFAVGRRGWAPTVQLTAYLRALPADGWLRVMCTATQIGEDWFDEDHIVVDCEGRIIVQTRQLAMVPAR